MAPRHGWLMASALIAAAAGAAAAPGLPTVVVVGNGAQPRYSISGQVEAVRQATIAAQVTGRVTAVAIANGDAVTAGQLLVRIDASEAGDTHAAAVAAQAAADAALVNAREEHARAQRLRASDYLSEAAMQRADAQLRSAEAQATVQRALAQAALRRSKWYAVTAPYAGRVTSLSVAAGDLATPGRPLLTVYDPAPMRVTAQLPEEAAHNLDASGQVLVEAGVTQPRPLTVGSWQIVPAVDAASRSVTVRVELADSVGLQPGQLLQLQLPLKSGQSVLRVPRTAVIRRSELSAVYVVGSDNQPRLRQVRVGAADGETVEILAGVRAGERVVVDASSAVGR